MGGAVMLLRNGWTRPSGLSGKVRFPALVVKLSVVEAEQVNGNPTTLLPVVYG